MNTHADKTQENKSQSVANEKAQQQSSGESTFLFVDNRPEAFTQRKLQKIANNSPQVSQLRAFHEMANNSPQFEQATQLQTMADNHSVQNQQPVQKKENNTGLPDTLKTGMESLAGMSLDDVKVHRNSDKPAQLQAHAYAQGTDIHLGSGQDQHLPHEAWHVVQQKQGRVKLTQQMKGGVNVNDDIGLENEADVMGAKAMQMKPKENKSRAVTNSVTQKISNVRQDLGFVGNRPEAKKRSQLSTVQANGLRYRGKKKEEKRVSFTVGRRTAFFEKSQATHAVYRMDGIVYGLAGDFGGVDIGADTEVKDPKYSWAGPDISISENEAQTFQSIAKSVSSKMTYNLVTQNCYTPVVTALQDLLNCNTPLEGEDTSETYLALDAFKQSLSKDNFGAGQQKVEDRAKKNQ